MLLKIKKKRTEMDANLRYQDITFNKKALALEEKKFLGREKMCLD